MKTFFLFRPSFILIVGIMFIGCSSTSELIPPIENTEEPDRIEEEIPVEILAPTEDWHLQSPNNDPYYGTGVSQAYSELLINKTPKKEVIVAIIDSGTDIYHEDLSDNIWLNVDEIPNNGIDDDGNGYIDDMHGWNFIGGADGSHVINDTYEITRLFVLLSDKYELADTTLLGDAEMEEFKYFEKISIEYENKKNEILTISNNISNFLQTLEGSKTVLSISSLDSVTSEQLAPSEGDSQQLTQAKQFLSYVTSNNINEEEIIAAKEQYETLANFGMNPDFDPRHIVGDDYDDLTNRYYGNNDVAGPTSEHGTHVAGIIGATRNNDLGINGIADVKLMIVRTVPNGDERDKDVANAIYYAAENGADVINMSFGKGYSPQKWYVDKAIQFADSMGVLMVHGAGNDGKNIDTSESYPTKFYLDGSNANNLINVGATSWAGGENVPASFSNYGKTRVEVFAPGVDIYSTFPDNSYSAQSGTSMASPVFAGVAALIMTYYPDLTTSQVKEILLETVSIPSELNIIQPGSMQTPTTVSFSELSITGGIVNAYEALKLADELSQY